MQGSSKDDAVGSCAYLCNIGTWYRTSCLNEVTVAIDILRSIAARQFAICLSFCIHVMMGAGQISRSSALWLQLLEQCSRSEVLHTLAYYTPQWSLKINYSFQYLAYYFADTISCTVQSF